jgi:hypothetical protein
MKSVVDVAIAFLSMLEKLKKPPTHRASGSFSFLVIHCEASCFSSVASGDSLPFVGP